MAATDIDALLEKLYQLRPDELARVRAVMEQLNATAHPPSSPFATLSGTISTEDAELMTRAVEDCERVDESAW